MATTSKALRGRFEGAVPMRIALGVGGHSAWQAQPRSKNPSPTSSIEP